MNLRPAPHARRATTVIAATIVLAGLLTGPGAPAAHAAGSAAPDSAPQPRTTVKWRECTGDLAGTALQCANLRVPLDPADPTGRAITLAVSRLRHTSSAARYRGVLLSNPGGPGSPGLALPLAADTLPRRVAGRYDWIGFDPRGVGASRPRLTCDRNYFGFDRPPYFPRPARNRDAWFARTQQYTQDCATKHAALLSHMRTTDSVADLERIREALGAERINYLGFSYGTYLGQVYATSHPDRVDRMILDGNINPTRVFYRANLDQNRSMQGNFNRWFAWIAQRDRQFGLGRSRAAVARSYNRTEARLARKPANGKIGSSEWADIYGEIAYSKAAWRPMATMFADYVRTDAAGPLVRTYRNSALFRSDNGFAVYNAVQCTDAPWPQQWATWSRDNWRVFRQAPNTTWGNAWFNAPCLYWPVAAGPRFVVDGAAAPPMLLIGATHDGPTPFSGSLAVRGLFPRASLVEMVGSVTHANSLGSACTRGYLARFLNTGALPTRRAGAGPDARCPARPRPARG